MARLIYLTIASLDGYVEDAQGGFEWAAPDEEVHAFVNDLVRPVGTYLYGRRMYETMVYWEADDDPATVARDFGEVWRAADKIVYSRTLRTASSARTRIEPEFDPEAIRRLKETSATDLAIGGAELAGRAIAAGLVDEFQLVLVPVLVGGGKRALPAGVQAELELLDERRFRSGFVYLRYGFRAAGRPRLPAREEGRRPRLPAREEGRRPSLTAREEGGRSTPTALEAGDLPG